MNLNVLEKTTPFTSFARDITRPTREVSEDRPDHVLWLDKNENCDPDYTYFLYEKLKNFTSKALFGYPDCHALYKKLALNLNVEINQLIVAQGSDGVIRSVYETFVAPGDTVIYTEPTFAMYPIYAKMFGAKSHVVHYERSEEDEPLLKAETMIAAILSSKPKLVGLPNPNSPTGTVFSDDELKKIIEAAGNVNAIILIDEAYYPFYPHTAIHHIHDYPHLIVARTFSKAWGCAGLRIGYGVANPALILECQKMRPMYEAGALSITLAERVLDFEKEMLASVQRLNAGKDYFISAMQQLGLKTFAANGNFLHVAFADYAEMIHQELANIVLYRQQFKHPSLVGFSRFTATTQELFTPIVEIIRRTIKG